MSCGLHSPDRCQCVLSGRNVSQLEISAWVNGVNCWMQNPDIKGGEPPNAGLDNKADFVNDDKKMEQFGAPSVL